MFKYRAFVRKRENNNVRAINSISLSKLLQWSLSPFNISFFEYLSEIFKIAFDTALSNVL